MKLEVVRRVHDLVTNGGYILASCHNVGYDNLVENVLALFEAAWDMTAIRSCSSKKF